jgi:hypothetical protein
MLKELTKSDWLCILNLPVSRVPDVVILRGTRNFRCQYKAILPYFENILELGTPNGILEDVLIGEVRGQSVGFACVYGSPMASEVVHLFGILGTLLSDAAKDARRAEANARMIRLALDLAVEISKRGGAKPHSEAKGGSTFLEENS